MVLDACCPQLFFGAAHAGNFRMGINNCWNRVVVHMTPAVDQLFGEGDALFLGFVREHRSRYDVANGNFSGLSLTAFQATLEGTANLQLNFQALAQAAETTSGTVTLIQPVGKTYFRLIGLLPVWVKVTFEVDAGFTASLSAQGTITAGASVSEQILYGQHWDQNNGWMNISQNPTGGFSFQQPA